MDAQVLGVSCDSRFTLAAWKQAMGYTVRFVSDFWPHGKIGARYGVFEERLGVHRRWTFVVDADGVIRSVIAAGELTSVREIASYLEALRSL